MSTQTRHPIRFAVIGCLAAMFTAAPQAAEQTDESLAFDIVGFNARGLYYGIEQFGFDSKGRPMAEVRIYDLRKDAEINRSPFLYIEQEPIPEGATREQAIEHARQGVYREAQRIIRFLTLVPRGRIIYAEKGDRPKALQVSTPPLSGMITLEAFPLASDHCKGIKTKGVRVKITRLDGEEIIHEDKILGKDRGCPVDYFLRAANVFQPYGDSVVIAVVLGAVQPQGRKPAILNSVVGHVWITPQKKRAQ